MLECRVIRSFTNELTSLGNVDDRYVDMNRASDGFNVPEARGVV